MSVNWCGGSWDHIDWGTAPDWIAGIGTAGALWFAFAGWRIAVRERHEAAVEKREQDARDRRAHAQQFTCREGGGSSTTADDGRMRFGLNVYVLNNSAHTFINVEVRVVARWPDGSQETGVVRWPQLLPNPNAVEEHKEVAVLHEDNGVRPLEWPAWRTEAWFTDKDGIRWRYQNGLLMTEQQAEVGGPDGPPIRYGRWWHRLTFWK